MHRLLTITTLLLAPMLLCGCEGIFKDLDDLPAPPPDCDETASDFSGGDGTADDPFRICTADDFNEIRAGRSYMAENVHFALLRDIDLDDRNDVELILVSTPDLTLFDDEPPESVDQDPVDTTEPRPFLGTFDGRGHTIENVVIRNRPEFAIGLFRHIGPEGTVKNLNLAGIDVEGVIGAAALAGINEGTVENCHVTNGRVVQYSDQGESFGIFIAALVGHNRGDIINSTAANMTIEALTITGGLVAVNDLDARIVDSQVDVTVRADNNIRQIHGDLNAKLAGGLVGINIGEIHRSRSRGSVRIQGNTPSSDTSSAVGGLVGAATPLSTITESASSTGVEASITFPAIGDEGTLTAGGLVGLNSGLLQDTYSSGSVTTTNSTLRPGRDEYVGGLVGLHLLYQPDDLEVDQIPTPTIKRSFGFGEIATAQRGATYRGGLVAMSFSSIPSITLEVTDSYWLDEIADDNTWGQPLTSAQFRSPSSFPGWSFDDIWQIPTGSPHPVLAWE